MIESKIEVVGVFTRDDEAGMKIWHEKLGHPSLKEEAQKLGIPVFEGVKVNSARAERILQAATIDAVFSCFWSEIFNERILNIPKLGCYNFHTAYLPKNRGSRPLPWAMIRGEKQAGITCHRMMTGVDNGPIVDQEAVEITDSDTGLTMYDRVTDAGNKLAKRVFRAFANNEFKLVLQDEEQATYQPRGEPFGRQLNPFWNEAMQDRFIRSFEFPPFSGALPAPDTCLQDTPKVFVAFSSEINSMEQTFPEELKATVFSPSISEETPSVGYLATPEGRTDLTRTRHLRFQLKSLKSEIDSLGVRVAGETILKQFKLLDFMKQSGFEYSSSHAQSIASFETDIAYLEILQPFRHENGLLEIPYWEINADEVSKLIAEAHEMVKKFERDIFVCLKVDESELKSQACIERLTQQNVEFITLEAIAKHYNRCYE